jgi:hypothetical protein
MAQHCVGPSQSEKFDMIRNFPAIAIRGSLVGAVVFALALAVEPAAAQATSGADAGTTDFSSQHDPRVSASKRGQGGGGQGRGFAGPQGNFQRGGPGSRGGFNPNAGAAPRMLNSPQGFRGPIGAAPGFRGSVGVAPGFRGPVGPRVVAPGFRGPGFQPSWRGGRAAFIRGPHRINRGGYLLPLVGLGVLGGIYVGSRQYTPYAFVDAPGADCQGPTDDGLCELRVTEVPLEDGSGAALQCVAYCPPR